MLVEFYAREVMAQREDKRATTENPQAGAMEGVESSQASTA